MEMAASSGWEVSTGMLADNPSTTWDFCTQPLPEESFLSWFTRLAKENCSDARLLYKELRKSPSPDPMNVEESGVRLQQTETNEEVRAKLIELLGSHVKMPPNSLQSFKSIPAFHKGDWDYLNTPLVTPRYCPSCLENDKTPYFRAHWFSKPHLVCPIHRILLRETCPHCDNFVEFWKTNWKEGINICAHCHQDLLKGVTGVYIVLKVALFWDIQQVQEKGIFRASHVDPPHFFRQLWKIISLESVHPLIQENAGSGRFIPAETLLQAMIVGLSCLGDDPERLELPFKCAFDNLKFPTKKLLKRHEKEHPITAGYHGKVHASSSPSKSYIRQQRPFHHLKPREILSIRDAIEEGTRVMDLSRQYKVSRATIYNAKNSNTSSLNDSLTKRRRKSRIDRQIRELILVKKRDFPRWGAALIRESLLQDGVTHISLATIYKVLGEDRKSRNLELPQTAVL